MKEESSLRPKKESTAGFFKTPARARDDIARRKRRRGKALRRIGTAVERGERERIVYRRRAAVVYKGYTIYNEEEAEAEEEESSSGGALVPDSISNNSHPRERARGVLGSAPPPARKGGSERRTRGKNDKSLSLLLHSSGPREERREESRMPSIGARSLAPFAPFFVPRKTREPLSALLLLLSSSAQQEERGAVLPVRIQTGYSPSLFSLLRALAALARARAEYSVYR